MLCTSHLRDGSAKEAQKRGSERETECHPMLNTSSWCNIALGAVHEMAGANEAQERESASHPMFNKLYSAAIMVVNERLTKQQKNEFGWKMLENHWSVERMRYSYFN